MVTPIEDVYRDTDLALRWLPGKGARMVVVFTGMKRSFGGAELDEFAKSASAKGENSVLFVTDRRATWFAAPGLWRRTVKLIKQVRNSEGIAELITLGTSMGGYAAMLLSRDLRVARAIAFAPQVSMDRDVIADERWPDIKARFGALPVRSLSDVVTETRTQYHITVSARCPEDRAHLDLLPESGRIHRYVLSSGRHNPARHLKEAGLLNDVIGAMIRGRRAQVNRIYDRFAEAA